MTEHTKGPWHEAPGGHILNAAKHVLARTFVGNPAMGWPGPTSAAERDANTARIVACVNACEGMADPAAEIAALRAIADAARTYIAGWYGGDGGRLPMSKYRSNLFDALERADIRCK